MKDNDSKAQEEWLSYGQTIICEGRTIRESVNLLEQAAAVVYFF